MLIEFRARDCEPSSIEECGVEVGDSHWNTVGGEQDVLSAKERGGRRNQVQLHRPLPQPWPASWLGRGDNRRPTPGLDKRDHPRG